MINEGRIVEVTEESNVERRSNSNQNLDDPTVMQNSDNPSMVLVIMPLIDSKFLT